MIKDARFEDADEHPLKLLARSADDILVVSALLQDAVTRVRDISWMPRKRRFAVLFNRFRWERNGGFDPNTQQHERVRTVLTINDVLRVRSHGMDPKATDAVLSLLSMTFEPGEDGAGHVMMTLAGDGELALDVECLDIEMLDATQPYHAVSGSRPKHPDN